MSLLFFDSGIGGLSVLNEYLNNIKNNKIPETNIFYFADTNHSPYGEKTKEFIQNRVLFISDFFINIAKDKEFLSKYTDNETNLNNTSYNMIFACNTATAHALEKNKKERPEINSIGIIQPAVEFACSELLDKYLQKDLLNKNIKINVYATTATVNSHIYKNSIIYNLKEKLNKMGIKNNSIVENIIIEEIPCPELVPTIENNYEQSILENQIYKYIKDSDISILGCTHYSLIKDMFFKVYLDKYKKQSLFIDPAEVIINYINKNDILSLNKIKNNKTSTTNQTKIFDKKEKIYTIYKKFSNTNIFFFTNADRIKLEYFLNKFLTIK